MSKSNEFIGVDISKDRFDVWTSPKVYKRFSNDEKGFEKFLLFLPGNAWVVMEATASYYQRLVLFLYESGVKVSVVNPVVIKRFIQMKLQHNKTDKSDARLIWQYATEQPLRLWEPSPVYVDHCKMIYTSVELMFKQSTALKNKLHSLSSRGINTGMLVRSLKRQVKNLQKEIALLEAELEKVIKENEAEMLTNLTSIAGIGKKTALLLIVNTSGFRSFQNHRQLSAYFGLSPTAYSSGSSVKGSSRISKRGNPIMRNHLFLCSFTACSKNAQCKALYQRIVNKGKSKKLALVAVGNKLLKQAFAIAKSGIPYNPDFKSSLAVE